MAVTLKHATEAVGPDAGNGEIRKAQWNEEHTITGEPNRLLGFNAAGEGVATRQVTGLLETAVRQEMDSGGVTSLDLSQGNLFIMTTTADTTMAILNPPAPGQMQAFVLRIKDGGSVAITWWNKLRWPLGIPPTLSEVGTDLLGFTAIGADPLDEASTPIYDGFVIAYDLRSS